MNEKEIGRAIARGIRKVLPVGAPASTGIREDLYQSVWVKLLEGGTFDTKLAYNAARALAKTWLRTEKLTPVSQMVLQVAAAEDDDSEELMPWDVTAHVFADDHEARAMSHLEDEERERIFNHLEQKDRRFLARYCSQNRKHTPAQRVRFQRLSRYMKKLYNK